MSEKLRVKFKRKDKSEYEEMLEMETPHVTTKDGYKVTKMILGYLPEDFRLGEKGVFPRLTPKIAKADDGSEVQIIVASKAEKIELQPKEKLAKVEAKLTKLKQKYNSLAPLKKQYDELKKMSPDTIQIIGKVSLFENLSKRFESMERRLTELEAQKKELQKQI